MSRHMIKGLFFDFDGVITMEKEGSPTIISYISKETGISYETIVNNTALRGLFDVIIISSDVHSRKSERMIFEEALKQPGLKADECVFIDNSVFNLDKPSEMGFNTIYFDDDKRDYSRLI